MIHPKLVALLTHCSRDFSDRTTMLVTADWAADHDMRSLEWLLRAWVQNPPDWAVFIGSRRYGVPRPDSDFDWVVPSMPHATGEMTWREWAAFKLRGTPPDLYIARWGDSVNNLKVPPMCDYSGIRGGRAWRTARFGPINLIETECNLRERWETVAAVLERHAPVTRDNAIRVIDSSFAL